MMSKLKMPIKIDEIAGTRLLMLNMALVDLRYTQGVLEISLSTNIDGELKRLKITFDWAMSFRLTDEGDLLKTQNDLLGEMVTGTYILEKSDYLSWFHEQSYNIHSSETPCHYLVVSSTEVVDVISTSAPNIEIIN